jgi:hypothetical protein
MLKGEEYRFHVTNILRDIQVDKYMTSKRVRVNA